MKIALNVGSGQRPFKSTEEVRWINIDSQERWNPDIICDASIHIPQRDETVDYVVLHHVLEHFGCGEGAGLVKECHRVLKPGGSLFVFVPNMRALSTAFVNGKLNTQLFLTNVYGAYMGSEDDRHKWGFDADSLAEFLASCALWLQMRYQPDNIPPGADCAHDWWILEMECVK